METVVFIACAIICVVGALGVIIAKNPVHSALMLVATLFGVAVLFLAMDAQFLAAVQVIVYAGAIVVLFLFDSNVLIRAREGYFNLGRVPRSGSGQRLR